MIFLWTVAWVAASFVFPLANMYGVLLYLGVVWAIHSRRESAERKRREDGLSNEDWEALQRRRRLEGL